MKNELKKLVKLLKETEYAEVYSPADKQLLAESAELLVGSGHAWSHELTDIYLICNGFFYNGIYLFSVRSDEADESYDLLVQNVQWDISERLDRCVLFGRSDEEVYVYNGPENKYQILDFTGWDEYYAFDSLAELLEFVITERL